MDPISVLVTAIVTGAAAGLQPTAEEAVKDAYQALKAVVKKKWGSLSKKIESVETNPTEENKTALNEQLKQVQAHKDREALDMAQTFLEVFKKYRPEQAAIILKDMEIGGSARFKNVRSSRSGVVAEGSKVGGDFEVDGVSAGYDYSPPASSFAGERSEKPQPHASVRMSQVSAGQDINIPINVSVVDSKLADWQQYLVTRGIEPYQGFQNPPAGKLDLSSRGVEHVSELRLKLLEQKKLDQPTLITVTGTLFPCALLSNGWWERAFNTQPSGMRWKDSLQEWLFNGFDLWAPSWDYSWNLDQPECNSNKQYFLAQLGGGDEADSLPVFIPREKAIKLREYFLEDNGGLEAEVTGLLGHRSQFPGVDSATKLFGGLLDFCLWLDDDSPQHKISLPAQKNSIYSGYLWKCLAPKSWLTESKGKLSLNQVYFVWEHTNFSQPDAIKFNLDSLLHKEEYLQQQHGELVLVQKSSALVPGQPAWSPETIYNLLLGKRGDDI